VRPGIDIRPSQIRAERLRAIWLGLTAAILTVIGLLNALPSNPVLYQNEVRVFASPIRVEKLRQLAAESFSKTATDKAASEKKKNRALVLTHVESIQASGPTPQIQVTNSDSSSRMEGIRVVCYSARHLSARDLQNHLQTISEPERFVRGDSEEARKLRWARWRLESAQHSLRQVADDLAETSSPEVSANTTVAESNPDSAADSPFQLTSTSNANNPLASSKSPESKIEQLRKIEQELMLNIDSEQRLIDELEQSVAKQHALSKGFLTLSSEPTSRPESRPLGFGNLFILVVAASLAGILVARAYFRRAIPTAVAVHSLPQQLETLGIRFLGTMSNGPAEPAPSPIATSRINYAIWLSRFTDALFVLCVIAIATRAVQDSQWRVFLASNPLMALAHLLRGL
jgi:hypothetical protein